MVEVFKTNVEAEQHAELLLEELSKKFPEFRINFDLSDDDKILRVEGATICPETIVALMHSNSYDCEILN